MPAYFDKHLFKPIRLLEKPSGKLSLIVVIPCHNEPDILSVINSLNICEPCRGSVEVIIVINSASGASEEIKLQNEISVKEIISWNDKRKNPLFKLFILHDEDLPPKHAGVGLARKIGMDEAASWFESIGKNDGVIVCLDADCTVASNYLNAIEKYFSDYPGTKAASIYFEHPLDIPDATLQKGIIAYELHLRYYVQALRYAGYPYAFHTIGSSMCVRSDVYQSAGGMNRRKAGEDFYFLHKIIPLGGFGEINTTTVYPSARVSERVPFGTGKAMKKWTNSSLDEYTTYDARVFDELKIFIQSIPSFYKSDYEARAEIIGAFPFSIQTYLAETEFSKKLKEINGNVSNLRSFTQRCFNWLDGFRMLKMIHYLRDKFYPDIPVSAAAKELLIRMKTTAAANNETELLCLYREWDKSC